MKLHIVVLVSSTLALYSCKNEPEQTSSADNNNAPHIETTSEAPQDAPADSVGWAGLYSGTTPCMEPCKGVKTKIQIRTDSSYTLSVQDIGRDEKPRIFSGTFNWDKEKDVITLDANGDHHKFLVRGGSLKELDKFGDPKQLGKQEDYILKKQ